MTMTMTTTNEGDTMNRDDCATEVDRNAAGVWVATCTCGWRLEAPNYPPASAAARNHTGPRA